METQSRFAFELSAMVSLSIESWGKLCFLCGFYQADDGKNKQRSLRSWSMAMASFHFTQTTFHDSNY